MSKRNADDFLLQQNLRLTLGLNKYKGYSEVQSFKVSCAVF